MANKYRERRPDLVTARSGVPLQAHPRSCAPAASRDSAIFAASLFNSPPTVSASPVYGSGLSPEALGITGLGMTELSSKSAFKTVIAAPATVAWPPDRGDEPGNLRHKIAEADTSMRFVQVVQHVGTEQPL